MEHTIPESSGTKHLSIQEKQKIVSEWKKTGLSKHQFCKEKGIIPTTFYGWCRQVVIASEKGSDLAPVAVVNKKPASFLRRYSGEADAEICLPNQTIVRLRLPVETLIAVIEGLSHAPHSAR